MSDAIGRCSGRCGACGSRAEPAFTVSDENRRITDMAFRYMRCPDCGLHWLANPPSDLSIYYPPDYHTMPTIERLGYVAAKERYQLDIVRAVASAGRLVEIGASTGAFALQAKAAGFDVTAIEMDARCVSHLRDTVAVHAIHSDQPARVLDKLPASRVVALWQVLEHLPNPLDVVAAAGRNLDYGGALVVSTPNPSAVQFRLMGHRWPHIDAPRHLWLIPPSVLVTEAAKYGLRLVLLTTDDPGGRRWNRFGWQRLLMNRCGTSGMRRAAFVVGAAVAVLGMPWERGRLRGSCYTAVLCKTPSP